MSGGVDSPLVALTAKRELQRQFAAPELHAYCSVYDHLIPDDERHYAGLVASSLSIPIDFQAIDDGALFDWVGRLSPPEPIGGPGDGTVPGPAVTPLEPLRRGPDGLRRRHIAHRCAPPALARAPRASAR